MTTKADFDAQEWETIEHGPMVAGLMVMAADRGGTIRETFSVARAYAEARAGGDGVVSELAESPPKLDRDRLGDIGNIATTGPTVIAESVSLLEAKADSNEVESFKRFCLDVAEHAAEATKSGGVLGIGGKRISEAESNALDSIAGTLGIERGVHDAPG